MNACAPATTRTKTRTGTCAASRDDWMKWVEKKALGMAGMGTAFAMGKLKFKKGDFKAMIKDPRMAGPFVKSFRWRRSAPSKAPRPSDSHPRPPRFGPGGQRQVEHSTA